MEWRDNQRTQAQHVLLSGSKANDLTDVEATRQLMMQEQGARGNNTNIKQRLRELKFDGIKDKFVSLKSSGTVHRRMSLAYYAIPCCCFTAIAISKLVSESFGIYLKYQALTDSFYQYELK